MSRSAQTIVNRQCRRRKDLALAWLHDWRHDPELAALLAAAHTARCLDNVFWFIAWSADRGLLLNLERLDRDGDPVPF